MKKHVFLLLTLLLPFTLFAECYTYEDQHCYTYMDPCCQQPCYAPVAGCGPVGIAPCYSYDMLSRLHYLAMKPVLLLQYRKCNPCAESILIGAQLEAFAHYTTTNSKNRFNYLELNVLALSGFTASDIQPFDFRLSVTFSPLCWLHGYWEFFNQEQQVFVRDPRQGVNQTRKVFAVIGNFDWCGLYATIGKRDIAFAQFYTVNPFTRSMTSHFFAPIHDAASIGYYNDCFFFEATAISGGRGIRVADSHVPGNISNFAFSGLYRTSFCGACINFGGGFLYSTLYDGRTPEHEGIPLSEGLNSAYDLSVEVKWCNWRTFFEFVNTTRDWPTTNHIIQTFSTGLSYCLCNPCLMYPTVLSFEYGRTNLGPRGTEFRRAEQYIGGIDFKVRKNIEFFSEYVVSVGFQPLPGILLPPANPLSPRNGVVNNTLLVGLRIAI